jgi:hypothetical protein
MTDPIDDCHGKKTCPWNDRKSERWVHSVDAATLQPRGGGEWVKRLAPNSQRARSADVPRHRDECPRQSQQVMPTSTHLRFIGGTQVAKRRAETDRGRGPPTPTEDRVDLDLAHHRARARMASGSSTFGNRRRRSMHLVRC